MTSSELDAVIAACLAEGIDPYPIMADVLRDMGYDVGAPDRPSSPTTNEGS